MNETTTTTLTTTNPIQNDDNNKPKEIVLDSLPYIDQIHEDYEDYALSLIQQEMDATTTTNNPDYNLKHLPNVPSTPKHFKKGGLNHVEYNKLLSRHGAPRTDAYVPSLPSAVPLDCKDVTTYKKSISDLKILHEQYRTMTLPTLELSSLYDSSLWRFTNKHQIENSFVASSQQLVQTQRQKVDVINAKRKRWQEEEVGVKLQRLEGKWVEGVVKLERLGVAEEKMRVEVEKWRGVLREMAEKMVEEEQVKEEETN